MAKSRQTIKLTIEPNIPNSSYIFQRMNVKLSNCEIKEVYNENRECEEDPDVQADPLTKDLHKKFDNDNAPNLFLKLAIGDTSVSSCLAMSFICGYGVNENERLSDLFSAIGIAVRDKEAIEVAKGIVIAKDATTFAAKCAEFIKAAALETRGRDIFYDEAYARGKAFDAMIKKGYGVSVFENLIEPPVYVQYVADTIYPRGFEGEPVMCVRHEHKAQDHGAQAGGGGGEETYTMELLADLNIHNSHWEG